MEGRLVGLYRSSVQACSYFVIPGGEDGMHAIDLGRERGRDVGDGGSRDRLCKSSVHSVGKSRQRAQRGMRAVRALEVGELGADGLGGCPQHDLKRGVAAEAADRERDFKHVFDLLENRHGPHRPYCVVANTYDGEGDLGLACDKSKGSDDGHEDVLCVADDDGRCEEDEMIVHAVDDVIA